MQTIYNLPKLYKRDTTGKIREWTIQYGWNLDETQAGTRVISGLQDGKKVTSEWYIKEAKNVGRANATTNITQAKAEAQSEWDKRVEKEYFEDIASIDSYTAFKPMLANDFTKTPVDSGITQPKLDGIRCIANGRGLYSRANKPIVAVPHIAEALKDFIANNPTITLDGELYNHELKDNFQKITSLVRKTVNIGEQELAESAELVQYHVYDMFDSANPDMIFMERYNWLQENLKTADVGDSIVKVSTHICDTPKAIDIMYGDYTTAGYEGQMIRQNTPYEFKRTKNLLKRKEFITEEYRVVEVQEGNGNWAGYAKRFILELADGTQFSSGVRGSQDKLAQLLKDKDTITWATCRYFELSNDGVPRFPVVIDYGSGTRDD
jgi:DNA ligase-1